MLSASAFAERHRSSVPLSNENSLARSWKYRCIPMKIECCALVCKFELIMAYEVDEAHFQNFGGIEPSWTKISPKSVRICRDFVFEVLPGSPYASPIGEGPAGMCKARVHLSLAVMPFGKSKCIEFFRIVVQIAVSHHRSLGYCNPSFGR